MILIIVVLFLVFTLVSQSVNAQVASRVQTGAATDSSFQWFIPNSPGNPLRVIGGIRDSSWFKMGTYTAQFNKMGYQRSDAMPVSNAGIAWLDDSGYVKRTIMANFKLPINKIIGLDDSLSTKMTATAVAMMIAAASYAAGTGLIATPNSHTFTVDPSYVMTVSRATDSINALKDMIAANTASINTKFPIPTGTTTQYIKGNGTLGTFPLLSNVAISGDYNDLSNKPPIPTNTNQLTNGAGYITGYTETDPVWNSQKANYLTTASAATTYQPAGTYLTAEVDGSVTNEIQTLSGSGNQINLTNGGSYTIPAQPFASLTGTPTTLAGYGLTTDFNSKFDTRFISNLTNSAITTGLGYTPISVETDPTTPAYSKTLSAFSVIKSSTDPLYRPITYVPSSSEITTSLGYTPFNSANFNSGFDTRLATKTTTDIAEGSNLYYTSARFNSAFSTALTGSAVNSALGYTAYNGATNPNGYINSVPAQSWTSITGKPTTLSGYGITDAYPLTGNPSNFLTSVTSGNVTSALGFTPVSQAGARTAISLTTTGTSGASTYNNTTGVLNIPLYATPTAPTITTVTRSLNTSYQISTTNNARVTYTVSLATTLSLLNLNSTAQCFLEISPNNSTWTTINGAGTANTLAVAISVGLNTTGLYNIQAEIPVGYYVRIRSSVAGGGTASFSSGQETIY